MKKIINVFFLALTLSFLVSCEDEKNPLVISNSFELLKDLTVTSPPTLQLATENDIFSKFTWNESNNGVESVSSYKLVVSDRINDPNFVNAAEYSGVGLQVTSSIRKCSLSVKEMNSLLNKLPTFKCSEMDVEVRIKSILGSNPLTAYVQYSNPINVKVTGYSTSQPILSFVKDGSAPTAAPKLLSSSFTSNTDFEAYMTLDAGNYKFYRPDSCGSFTSATVLGGTGTLAAGVIDATGASNIVIPTTGYYQIKANLTTNTFSIKEFTSVGVFGRATRAGLFGFNNIVPMNYDATNKKWTLTMDLLRGQALKFRTVKWTGALIIAPTAAPFPKPDYIPSGSTTVSTFGTPAANVLADDSNTDIKTGGTASLVDTDKYLVEVDISNPRKYTYKLTKI